jgi:TRAP-type mannitol/chloroaromatic compound transport system permease large subunit
VLALLNRAVTSRGGMGFLSPLSERVTFVMVPPLLLIFLVLGTILIGLATPTEGGAMGAAGAMLLAAAKRYTDKDPARFNWAIVRSAAQATAKLSAFVMFILIGARIFSLTFYGVNGHIWVEHLLTAMPGGLYGFLIAINLMVFLLAFFLDFFELAFIIVPLIKPAAEAMFRTSPEAIAMAKSFGFAVLSATDPSGAAIEKVADVGPFMIWLGVLLAVNMQTSFMHPPFGFALFYLRSVAPAEPYKDRLTGKLTEPVTTAQIYWGAVPYVGIQIFMVALVLAAPWLVIKAKPPRVSNQPPAMSQPAGNTAGAEASRMGRTFALPPSPPEIEGASAPPQAGPGAPTLNMDELPNFDKIDKR